MGAYASLEQNTEIVQAVGSSIGGTGTRTGRAIDTAGFSEALAILAIGASAATGSLAVKMQDCATESGIYADVTGAAWSAKANADDTCYSARVKLDGNTVKRWVKFVGVTSADVVDYTVVLVLSGGQYKPEAPTTTGFAPGAEWTV